MFIDKIKTLSKVVKTVRNYPLYLKDYMGLKKGRILLYELRNGVKYKVRGGATDRFILNEIWLHRSYNPPGFEINKNDTVVDIGAHIGIFTIYAAHYARTGKVYSFEPAEANFNLLRENVRINNFRNVEVFNKAVGSKKGRLKFFVSQTRNKGQNSMYRLGENQKEVQVDKISFKDFLKKLKKIDFLKMDCEGAEYDILFSLSEKELGKISKISMEYHNYADKKGEDLAEYLKNNGFKVVLIKKSIFGSLYAKKTDDNQ